MPPPRVTRHLAGSAGSVSAAFSAAFFFVRHFLQAAAWAGPLALSTAGASQASSEGGDAVVDGGSGAVADWLWLWRSPARLLS